MPTRTHEAEAEALADQVCRGLGECRRVVVVGGPGTGKTTLAAALARRLGAEHRTTDALVDQGLEWSEVSDRVAGMLGDRGAPWVLEGAAAVRGLRKWLRSNNGHPGVVVVNLDRPVAGRTPRQEAMAKGVGTVWRQVAPALRARGVKVMADVPPPNVPSLPRGGRAPRQPRTIR